MAHHQRDQHSSVQGLVKMLQTSNFPKLSQLEDEDELAADVDEPPDLSILPHPRKSPTVVTDTKKESLLTRALLSSPELRPVDGTGLGPRNKGWSDIPALSTHGNFSAASTAELTSDGGNTSPERCNTPSPPLPSQYARLPTMMGSTTPSKPDVTTDTTESTVEANLGRKRCITFACGRRADDSVQSSPRKASTGNVLQAPPMRKTALTFACPARVREVNVPKAEKPVPRRASACRPRGSPAPTLRKSGADLPTVAHQQNEHLPRRPECQKTPIVTGLGVFEHSEATRFHEFASSEDEDDEWVKQSTEYKDKITLQDCLKKENAIRKLGEEAEEEARQDEEDEEDANDDDDDGNTVHDFSSDDGNESDNEAGFADSDDDSDDGSENQFWTPSITTAATSADHLDIFRPSSTRDITGSSAESISHVEETRRFSLGFLAKDRARRLDHISPKMRPGTPNLPDSTDFVCGTLDEDRPMEAAYISCMEERRRSKHVPIPQDIDPSFPTTDPEDNDDDIDDDIVESVTTAQKVHEVAEEDGSRGRSKAAARKTSPQLSPRRFKSPPPRRLFGHSPKRLRSPPPLSKLRSPPATRRPSISAVPRQAGVNITGLAQRPTRCRTTSLPRTPNPFFLRLERSRQSKKSMSDGSDGRDTHTRGPIDIVEGLEKKRQKRKEKFWRQHCRKAAKEQQEKRPLPGRGAERMKELGLEVAERWRGYGVGLQSQLVLSI